MKNGVKNYPQLYKAYKVKLLNGWKEKFFEDIQRTDQAFKFLQDLKI
ncbi:hypothetical protein [Bacillus sp. FJAT-52991]|uniref:Transposase n=1 Tax=Bacillus kandeliae TaxID=3129297 RepID=A0ABZ2N6J6_9BACI